MSASNIVIIICICIVVVYALCYALFDIIQYWLKRKVLVVSTRYKELYDINLKYHFFNDLDKEYKYSKQLKSKRQFDRFNYDEFFEEEIEENLDFIEDIIYKLKENRRLFEKYKREVNELTGYSLEKEAKEGKMPAFIYKILEEEIFLDNMIRPIMDIEFICQASYLSPQGRNYYENEIKYSLVDLESHYDNVKNRIKEKETKTYQRKMMTDSLRYDILKRDEFKCVICGRTAQDDVKLHVDHIIPVSKGGKTVKNNLRTLCNSCNLGKSDKYDEDGIN